MFWQGTMDFSTGPNTKYGFYQLSLSLSTLGPADCQLDKFK
jgi:hypothetical protein